MLDYVSSQLRGELRHLPEERRPACAARSRGRWGGRSTCRRASPLPSWWTWPAGPWTWWGRCRSVSLTLSPATLRGDGLLWLCQSCLPLAVITGLCVSLMDVFIASGLVQWVQIARIVYIVNTLPLYLQGGCFKTEIPYLKQTVCRNFCLQHIVWRRVCVPMTPCWIYYTDIIFVPQSPSLTVTVWGIWGSGVTGQELSAAHQFVFYERPLLIELSPQAPRVFLQCVIPSI